MRRARWDGLPAESEGYDGQFAYYIARDPGGSPPCLVRPPRMQRILLPVLARPQSGADRADPWALVLVNLIAGGGRRCSRSAGSRQSQTLVRPQLRAVYRRVHGGATQHDRAAGLRAGHRGDLARRADRWWAASIALALAVFAKEVAALFAAGMRSFRAQPSLARRGPDRAGGGRPVRRLADRAGGLAGQRRDRLGRSEGDPIRDHPLRRGAQDRHRRQPGGAGRARPAGDPGGGSAQPVGVVAYRERSAPRALGTVHLPAVCQRRRDAVRAVLDLPRVPGATALHPRPGADGRPIRRAAQAPAPAGLQHAVDRCCCSWCRVRCPASRSSCRACATGSAGPAPATGAGCKTGRIAA